MSSSTGDAAHPNAARGKSAAGKPPHASDPVMLERRVSPDLSSTNPLSAAARLRQILGGSRVMRVLILSSDTGGGHRASAAALRAALLRLYPNRVKIDVVDFWVEFAQGTFKAFPEQYSFLAKHPFLWKLSYELTRFPPIRGAQEWSFNVLAHNNVRSAFEHYAPDLVVSVHPLVNTLSLRVLQGMREESQVPSPPFVTVVTDLGGCHPTWFCPKADMVYVPTDAVRKIALACRMAPSRLRQFGLPVREDFWKPMSLEYSPSEEGTASTPKKLSRDELRNQLGMRRDLTAFLLVGGGDGVGNLGPVAKSIAAKISRDHGENGAQLVVVCGKNVVLRDSLQNHRWGIPVIVNGFVNNMSDWMEACDVLCTKAGPGTIAEGLIRGMPVLISGFLPGQEEANVRYIVEKGIGEFASRPAKIAAIASRWLSNPGSLEAMSAHALNEAHPQASLEIVDDVWDVATAKMVENIAVLEQRQRLRAAQAALARAHLRNARNGNPILTRSQESFLYHRLRVFMRLMFGGVITAEAAGITIPVPRLRN